MINFLFSPDYDMFSPKWFVIRLQELKEIEEKVFLTRFLKSFSFYYQFVNDLQFKSNYGKIVS